MHKVTLTSDLLKRLRWVKEHQLRYAIRIGKLTPERMPTGLFYWPDREVKRAERYFRERV